MTGFVPTAFVAAPVAGRVASSTALQVVRVPPPEVLHDCTKGALSFFNGIRTPAALIAGSSLAALFSMLSKYRAPQKTRGEKVVLRIFHACALFGYLLSVTTVVAATTAGTTLLLGNQKLNPMAASVYIFMKREMRFEFAFTRWCFLTGVLNFLIAMGGRVIMEFDLMQSHRVIEKYVVILALGGMIGQLISVVNSSLISWANLSHMTADVVRMATRRAFDNRHPLAMVSLVSVVAALGASVYTIVKEALGLDHNDTISSEESTVLELDYMPSVLASATAAASVDLGTGPDADGGSDGGADVDSGGDSGGDSSG